MQLFQILRGKQDITLPDKIFISWWQIRIAAFSPSLSIKAERERLLVSNCPLKLNVLKYKFSKVLFINFGVRTFKDINKIINGIEKKI